MQIEKKRQAEGWEISGRRREWENEKAATTNGFFQ